jgi:hypothetical protein
VPSDPSLAIFLVAMLLCSAALGAYIGIARGRAPLGAPEPRETIDRRLRFKTAHIHQARRALILTAGLFVASIAYLVLAHL